MNPYIENLLVIHDYLNEHFSHKLNRWYQKRETKSLTYKTTSNESYSSFFNI